MNLELHVIKAIWKREIIRFFRSKSRVVGTLGMPFFFLVIVGTGLEGSIMPEQVGGNYLEFMAPGILSMVLIFGSIFSGVIVIMDRQFGFLKETLVAPVRRTSIVIGKSLGGGTTAIFQGMMMLVIAWLMGVDISLDSLPFIFLLMVVVSVTFVSLGTAIASLMEDMHGFQLIMGFLVMPMFFLSGAIFPLENAPVIMRYLSYIDPLTYSVEAFRFLMTGSSLMPLEVSVTVLVSLMVLCTVSAAYLFGKIEES